MIDLKTALESVKYNKQNPLQQLGLNTSTELNKLNPLEAGGMAGGQTGLITSPELGNTIQSVAPGILKQILGAIAL